jgi:hypothetical protein
VVRERAAESGPEGVRVDGRGDRALGQGGAVVGGQLGGAGQEVTQFVHDPTVGPK